MTVPFSTVGEFGFLNGARARAYARILLVLMGTAEVYYWVCFALRIHPGFPDPPGQRMPGPSDFLAFWSAGRLALEGAAARAYDLAALGQFEHAAAAFPGDASFAFFYPPTYLLLCLPFAGLPYIPAFFAFVAAQLAVLLALLRRLLPAGWGLLPALAFPGLLINAAAGQNGFVFASCYAAGALLLDTRPVLAGACLGLLAVKPQLAVTVPVVLLAGRRWRAALAACGMALLLLAASYLVLGRACWEAFLRSTQLAGAVLEHDRGDWGKLQSVFTTVRLWGGSLAAGFGAQGLATVAVVALVAVAAWRRPDGRAAIALAASGALLCTPHLLDYDLAIAGVPLAYVAAEASRTGWRRWEKACLSAAFVWPLLGRLLTLSGVALAPFVLAGLFAVTLRRTSQRQVLGLAA